MPVPTAPPPYGTQLPTISQPSVSPTLGASLVRGALAALAAGAVAGLLWFGIVAFTERQIYYLAVILGFVIGAAASWGAGRGGISVASISAVLALVTVVLSYFYIDRWFIVKGLSEAGYSSTLGLWPRYDQVKDVLDIGFDAEPSQYLFCVLAVGGAIWAGATGVAADYKRKR